MHRWDPRKPAPPVTRALPHGARALSYGVNVAIGIMRRPSFLRAAPADRVTSLPRVPHRVAFML
ncbi:hypothetical protein GCM10010216_15640 [Streptomyces flaveolus]|nr:hypothetical protein GCM10010216_15640 [Streptomyces flaveolus]